MEAIAGFVALAAIPVWVLFAFIGLTTVTAATTAECEGTCAASEREAAQDGAAAAVLVISTLLSLFGFGAIWTVLSWITIRHHRTRRKKWRARHERTEAQSRAAYTEARIPETPFLEYRHRLQALLDPSFPAGRTLMVANLVFAMGALAVFIMVPLGIISWVVGISWVTTGRGAYDLSFAAPGFVVSLILVATLLPGGATLKRIGKGAVEAARRELDAAEEAVLVALHDAAAGQAGERSRRGAPSPVFEPFRGQK